jgi:hypothetical protein
MIFLLAIQATVVLTDVDRASYRDYRECVLEQIARANLDHTNTAILGDAKKICEDGKVAGASEIIAGELEQEIANGVSLGTAEHRIAVLDHELLADATAQLQRQREKVSK